MKQPTTSLVCCLLFMCFLSCKKQAQEPLKTTVNTSLLQDLKILSHDSLQGRFFGTEGSVKAQLYMAKRFEALKLETVLSSGYIQPVPYTFTGKFRERLYPNTKTDTTVTGGNVLAVVRGSSNKTIVVTGHIDHLGVRNSNIYNGTDDNASGSAALLAIGEHFKSNSPKHNIILAAVDGEEIGSLGCAYMLEHLPEELKDIILNVNMDMIAHSEQELFASGLYHYPQLKPALEGLTTPLTLRFGHDNSKTIGQDDWTYSSDHREFHKRGIPYVYFGVEDHEDYHKHTDTFETINPSFYTEAVKLIIQAIERLDKQL